MRRPRGALLLVLHAHLPYVRHPDDEDHLEEEWLREAVLECYLPLLELLERLGMPFRSVAAEKEAQEKKKRA